MTLQSACCDSCPPVILHDFDRHQKDRPPGMQFRWTREPFAVKFAGSFVLDSMPPKVSWSRCHRRYLEDSLGHPNAGSSSGRLRVEVIRWSLTYLPCGS
jgi:hypothetical protein